MPTHVERILHIFGEAVEPLFPSEITERLNHELGPGSAYSRSEVMTCLQGLAKEVTQLDIGHADRAKAHRVLVTGVTEKLHARA